MRSDAWDVLERAGVPTGGPRPRGAIVDAARVRSILVDAASDPASLSPVEREALVAWLAAFEQHFPSRFARDLGEVGAALARQLRARGIDEGRYLKLRRIALANLAHAAE